MKHLSIPHYCGNSARTPHYCGDTLASMRGYHYLSYQLSLGDVSMTEVKESSRCTFSPLLRGSLRLCGPFLCPRIICEAFQLPLVAHVGMMSGLSLPQYCGTLLTREILTRYSFRFQLQKKKNHNTVVISDPIPPK